MLFSVLFDDTKSCFLSEIKGISTKGYLKGARVYMGSGAPEFKGLRELTTQPFFTGL